jgi:Family of unknown function (DUF6614)
MMAERPFSPKQLAERWGTVQHVHKLIRKEKLGSFRIGEKLLRIPAEEVKRWEALQQATSSESSTDGESSPGKKGRTIEDAALFDLKPGVAEGDFKKALEDFCGHLKAEGYVICWRWMRQITPAGPSFPHPTQAHLVAFEFLDEAADERCYEYVAADAEPIRSFHRAMNCQVERASAIFFVCAEV